MQGREDMEKSKAQALLKRTLSALVMIPVVFGALWYGAPFMNFLVMLIGVILAWEWSSMVPSSRQNAYAVAYTVAAVFSAMVPFPGIVWGTIIAVCWLAVIVLARHEEHKYLLMLGVPYISLGAGAINWLYETSGFPIALLFFLAVWSVDIGGYFVGSTLKGPKLAPKISPNKTWSGLIGGVLLAVLVTGGLVYYFTGTQLLLYVCLLSAAVAVVAQIGDLIESAIKRHLGLKDSSNLIPGHGGMFDRVDGLIFSAPMLYLALQIVDMINSGM